ncbi:S-layer homology domain-containing protein [Anoxybacillus sp. LAT_35]|uniref:S-layer homology domain-containing protein n=1 Tax=unclassified Anoxybacillus TaxID=2639704 RepID=UPI001EEA2500|nr:MULTISPECIES: S-layer homology domain-containing protein [unclassified Anoxybacillus]MCG6170948.1 S-layer homology domain-containing protein [Anoxybacillus sp. LAT_11]MCG6178829.1 S-layer homology domain-containing protein [Anoxybacillus sp. LAT_35]MCG6182506.1 S-layer homology domain-containing protein [Anoxybacillus sp. LAT_26]MCG6197103.1 S-layer homology domain-containing protein [Anoxybacillus sp. LAT_38]
MAYQPKSYRKFLAGTVSAAVVASAIAPVASAASFTDVAGSVHADDIATLVAKGYIKGYADGTFKPDQSLTRGEAAIIFSRILKDMGVTEKGAGFPDVPAEKAELAEAVAIVQAAGIMTGDEKGNFNPNANITREQMAKVLVEAFDLMKPADFVSNVTDLDKAASWAREYIQVLDATDVTLNTEFMPKQNVTRGQFASFVVRAMNVGVTAANITGVAFVDLNTLEVTFNGELKEVKKEDFAIEGVEIESVSIKAAAAAEAKTTVVVIKTKTALEEGKAYNVSYKGQTTDKAKVDVPVVTPKVESVSANNLKEITVTFNKSLDKAAAETASNYTLSSGTVSSAKLDESGKVVTLTLASAAAQQASVDVTIKNVKDVDGKVVADTTKSVKFFDTAVPAAQKIEVTGPKTLRVYFSEPITSTAITTVSNFSIDNNTYSISSVAGTPGNNYVDITLGATLPEGTHKLTVNAQNLTTDPAIKDFAGFFVPKAELSFEYKADKAAPVVTVDKVSQNSVTLKFNKDIDPTTRSYLTVYHTYNNVSGYQGSVSWTDNKTAVVTFASNYLPVGNATLYVNAGTGSNLVKDTWGNAFASTSLNANVVADNEAPTVKEVKVVDSTHIDVTFSEAVSGATTASNYTLTDSTGAPVTVSSVSNTTGNTYRLTTATLNGGSYTLTIKGIKDTSVSQNAMADYTTTVNVTDLVRPTVTTTGVYSTDKKKIVISFSEAMATTGAGSVLDKTNYQVALNGTNFVDLSTFTGSSITLGADGKSVIIDLGSVQSGLQSGSKVRVARVADLAGNTTSDFTTDVTLSVDDVTVANISDVKAIAQNKVQFKLNTALSAIDVSKFTIKVGTTDRPATAATYVNNGNTSIVTVEVADADKFATDLNDLVNVQFTAGAVTTALGTSNSDTVTQTVAPATADYVAPTMGTVATGDLNSNGKIDQVTVTFSESLYVASVQESDFTVEGYEITGVSVSGGTVTLTVKEKSTVDTGVTPKVTLVGSVSDNTAQRNSVGNLAAVTATDSAAPVLVGTSLASDDKTLTLTFSENIANNTADANALKAAITFAADGSTFDPLAAGDSVAISGNTLTITFNTALTGNTNKVQIAASTLKDTASTPVVQSAAITTAAIDATTN